MRRRASGALPTTLVRTVSVLASHPPGDSLVSPPRVRGSPGCFSCCAGLTDLRSVVFSLSRAGYSDIKSLAFVSEEELSAESSEILPKDRLIIMMAATMIGMRSQFLYMVMPLVQRL